MPWSDSFIQNYVGYQYNGDYAWEFTDTATFSPEFGTQFVDTQTLIDTPNEYDPIKQSTRRVAIAIPTTFTLDPNSLFVGGIYTSNGRGNTPRFLVTYNEIFSPYNNADIEPKQQILMDFDDVILSNNTLDEWVFRSVALIHCALDTSIISGTYGGDLDLALPEIVTFERLADSTNPAFPYVYEAQNFPHPIPLRTRYTLNVAPNTSTGQFLFDLPPSILASSVQMGTAGVGGFMSAYYIGAYTIASYTFPQAITLLPGQDITFNFGTIVKNFNAFGRVC